MIIYRKLLLYIGISFLFLGIFPFKVSAKSYTESYNWARNPFSRDRNPYKPKTIFGVHKAYRTLIFRKNGISKEEARIIAQYQLIESDLYRDYDFRKPKVVEEKQEKWVIRFPGKYSLTHQKVTNYIYFINKSDGSIISSQESDTFESGIQ